MPQNYVTLPDNKMLGSGRRIFEEFILRDSFSTGWQFLIDGIPWYPFTSIFHRTCTLVQCCWIHSWKNDWHLARRLQVKTSFYRFHIWKFVYKQAQDFYILLFWIFPFPRSLWQIGYKICLERESRGAGGQGDFVDRWLRFFFWMGFDFVPVFGEIGFGRPWLLCKSFGNNILGKE